MDRWSPRRTFARALGIAALAVGVLVACAEPGRTAGASAGPERARPDGAPSGDAPRRASAADFAAYRWLAPGDVAGARRLVDAVPTPPGFTRVTLAPGSFGAFLRGLPLRPRGSAVHAHDGRELLGGSDPRVTAVIHLDPGTRDLQQCADTAIRLHAEWLWSRGDEAALGYHFTSGDLATWSRHRAGERPVVDGARVRWERRAAPSSGRETFRSWLDLVFTYAGTVSLAREGAVVDRADARPGDVFVLPGGPGHAVIVLDVARDGAGRRVALLGQGFMPAQEAHVLAASPGRAWFDLDAEAIDTPFWPAPFPWSALRRMRTASGATE